MDAKALKKWITWQEIGKTEEATVIKINAKPDRVLLFWDLRRKKKEKAVKKNEWLSLIISHLFISKKKKRDGLISSANS